MLHVTRPRAPVCLCMCMHVCIYMWVCSVCKCICAHIQHMCACVPVSMCTCMCVHECVDVSMHNVHYVYMYTCMCECACTHAHALKHACVCIRVGKVCVLPSQHLVGPNEMKNICSLGLWWFEQTQSDPLSSFLCMVLCPCPLSPQAASPRGLMPKAGALVRHRPWDLHVQLQEWLSSGPAHIWASGSTPASLQAAFTGAKFASHL